MLYPRCQECGNRRIQAESELWRKAKTQIETTRVSVQVRGPHGVEPATIVYTNQPPDRLQVTLSDGTRVESEAHNLYKALILVRLKLESEGYFICCQGARINVGMSGMSAQMSGGLLGHQLYRERESTRDDLVNIFEPADCDDVVSVEQQREWLDRHDREYWRARAPAALLEAMHQVPGGWVLVVEDAYLEHDPIPSEGIQGAWKVDSEGEEDGYFPNLAYARSLDRTISRSWVPLRPEGPRTDWIPKDWSPEDDDEGNSEPL